MAGGIFVGDEPGWQLTHTVEPREQSA